MQWNPNKHEPLEYLMQRLAIDFDSLDYWEIYAVVYKLQGDGYHPKVWRTRHGYHIVCQVCIPQNKNSEKLGFWSLLKLRSRYGDDPKRISSDIA